MQQCPLDQIGFTIRLSGDGAVHWNCL